MNTDKYIRPNYPDENVWQTLPHPLLQNMFQMILKKAQAMREKYTIELKAVQNLPIKEKS